MRVLKSSILKIRITTFVVIVIVLLSCIREDDYYSLNSPDGLASNSIFYFSEIMNSDVEADGNSKFQVKIKIHPESTVENREISLETTLGLFGNGRNTDTITVDVNGRSIFYLSSSMPGHAKVRAKVNAFLIDTVVSFIPALPHDMLVSLDNFKIDTAQSVEISTSLFRDPFKGEVSDPIKVFYSIVSDSIQSNSLVFPVVSFSDNGISTISVDNPFFLRGTFDVEARTLSAKNDTIRRIARFTIE